MEPKTNTIRHIATALLFDRNGKLLIYLRDNKPTIPFPNCWDLFGGHVENDESAEEALTREIKEELGITINQAHKFRDYECFAGDAYPNIKHVYWAKIDYLPDELDLKEGQKLTSIDISQKNTIKFANILAKIVSDFALSKEFQRMQNELSIPKQ